MNERELHKWRNEAQRIIAKYDTTDIVFIENKLAERGAPQEVIDDLHIKMKEEKKKKSLVAPLLFLFGLLVLIAGVIISLMKIMVGLVVFTLILIGILLIISGFIKSYNLIGKLNPFRHSQKTFLRWMRFRTKQA